MSSSYLDEITTYGDTAYKDDPANKLAYLLENFDRVEAALLDALEYAWNISAAMKDEPLAQDISWVQCSIDEARAELESVRLKAGLPSIDNEGDGDG